METRRTNQFLRVALGARSPARPKYFKGKFHDGGERETRLNFPMTAPGGERTKFAGSAQG